MAVGTAQNMKSVTEKKENLHEHTIELSSSFSKIPIWKIKISLNEEWFYIWVEAYNVEQLGYGDLFVDRSRVIKTQGCIESIEKEN